MQPLGHFQSNLGPLAVRFTDEDDTVAFVKPAPANRSTDLIALLVQSLHNEDVAVHQAAEPVSYVESFVLDLAHCLVPSYMYFLLQNWGCCIDIMQSHQFSFWSLG